MIKQEFQGRPFGRQQIGSTFGVLSDGVHVSFVLRAAIALKAHLGLRRPPYAAAIARITPHQRRESILRPEGGAPSNQSDVVVLESLRTQSRKYLRQELSPTFQRRVTIQIEVACL